MRQGEDLEKGIISIIAGISDTVNVNDVIMGKNSGALFKACDKIGDWLMALKDIIPVKKGRVTGEVWQTHQCLGPSL